MFRSSYLRHNRKDGSHSQIASPPVFRPPTSCISLTLSPQTVALAGSDRCRINAVYVHQRSYSYRQYATGLLPLTCLKLFSSLSSFTTLMKVPVYVVTPRLILPANRYYNVQLYWAATLNVSQTIFELAGALKEKKKTFGSRAFIRNQIANQLCIPPVLF